MPRGLHNWGFRDVKRFLNGYGFRVEHVQGGHYFFKGRHLDADRLVCVPFHGMKAIAPKTMKSIIEQSGIVRSEWK